MVCGDFVAELSRHVFHCTDFVLVVAVEAEVEVSFECLWLDYGGVNSQSPQSPNRSLLNPTKSPGSVLVFDGCRVRV